MVGTGKRKHPDRSVEVVYMSPSDDDDDFEEPTVRAGQRRSSRRVSRRTQSYQTEHLVRHETEDLTGTVTRSGRSVKRSNRLSDGKIASEMENGAGGVTNPDSSQSDVVREEDGDDVDDDDDIDDDDKEVIVKWRSKSRDNARSIRQPAARVASRAEQERQDARLARKFAADEARRTAMRATRARTGSSRGRRIAGDLRDVGPIVPPEVDFGDEQTLDQASNGNDDLSSPRAPGRRLRKKAPISCNEEDDDDYEIEDEDQEKDEDEPAPDEQIEEEGVLEEEDAEETGDADADYTLNERPKRQRARTSRYSITQEPVPRRRDTRRKPRQPTRFEFERRPRRAATRPSTSTRVPEENFRSRGKSMRPGGYYDAEKSSDEEPTPVSSDSSDEIDIGVTRGTASAPAKPDYRANPMAVADDVLPDGRSPRPSRYARRRNRPTSASGGRDGELRRSSVPGIEPIQVDLNLSWDDVGGLDHHIRALKEMVFLPLLYPEVFEKFQMEPPKGVLFYGPPGTGKTLCARALAASCGAVSEVAAPKQSANVRRGLENRLHVAGVTSVEEPAQGGHDANGGILTEQVGVHDIQAGPENAMNADQRLKQSDASPKASSAVYEEDGPHKPDDKPAEPDSPSGKEGQVLAEAEPASIPSSVPVPSSCLEQTGVREGDQLAALGLASPLTSGIGDDQRQKQRPRVAFFMRNGADCLSKWVGEAERQLRMTFEAAKKHQPSIIFFDEIDGLAPVRSARQDQIHSSIVSTLLGLMDGLDARGQIVVIGATNRIDSVDPALRRPGRFDRELIFTLPNGVARRRILSIHTANWKPEPPDNSVLDAVAARTVGYCGADLRALCTEAALRALRRRYPQIYNSQDKLLIDVDQVRVRTRDFIAAMNEIVPASHRSARTYARPLPVRLAPILSSSLMRCVDIIRRIFPQGLASTVFVLTNSVRNEQQGNILHAQPDIDDDDGFSDDETSDRDDINDIDVAIAGKQRSGPGGRSREKPVLRPRILVCGPPGLGQTQIGPALLHSLEGCPVHPIDLPSLFADGGSRSPEESLVTAVREACRSVPSILFLPHLQIWWDTASESLRTTLLIALRDIPAELPLLVLATAERAFDKLPEEVTELFADFLEMEVPSRLERAAMFSLIREEAVRCPIVTEDVIKRRRANRRSEVLLKAPPPLPKPVTESERVRREHDDDKYIRALRIEMRVFVERMLRDRKYKAFWLPVDPVETPDYLQIIKEPMDLSKIAAQVDKGMYPTVLAMVKDFDTMVKNAITYNPAHTEEGAAILRRAHALIDIVHTWVDNLDPDLVERCNSIVTARISSLLNDAPSHGDLASNPVIQNKVSVSVNGGDSVLEWMDPKLKTEPKVDCESVPVARSVDCHVMKEPLRGRSVRNGAVMVQDQDCIRMNGILAAGAPVQGTEGQAVDESCEREKHEMEVDQAHAEEAYVEPSRDELEQLEQSWIDVTTGLGIDALDSLQVRCSSVLYSCRRSRDRRGVVRELIKLIEEARDDPTLKLVA